MHGVTIIVQRPHEGFLFLLIIPQITISTWVGARKATKQDAVSEHTLSMCNMHMQVKSMLEKRVQKQQSTKAPPSFEKKISYHTG